MVQQEQPSNGMKTFKVLHISDGNYSFHSQQHQKKHSCVVY